MSYHADHGKLYNGDRLILAGPPDHLARFVLLLGEAEPEDDNALRTELRRLIEEAGPDVSFAPYLPWSDDELMGLAERERLAQERERASRQMTIFDVLHREVAA